MSNLSAPLPASSRKTEPFIMVIFGASGDLTVRKLVPALFGLFKEGSLPEQFVILGFARREKTDESFRAEMFEGVEKFSRFAPVHEAQWEAFASHLFYHRGSFDEQQPYDDLHERIKKLRGEIGSKQEVFYLSTAPDYFCRIVQSLHQTGLVDHGLKSRVVIEKPFGHDLTSANELVKSLQECLDESSLFRIDHYLGKETVQNLLYFRFSNSIFEPIWNRSMIDNVQITVAEEVGVGTRGGYYDGVGAMRDMVQNHLMQLLTITAMEPPATLKSGAIHDEKVKVLRSIPTPDPTHVSDMCVRAQYEGYRASEKVSPDSKTETYVALRMEIDNWRWAGVPFYLRTGKSMASRSSEIVVVFKRPPMTLFDVGKDTLFHRNRLHIRLQPHEGLHLFFNVKQPGKSEVRSVDMDFAYQTEFGSYSPEAYERLLHDAIIGDSTLFTRADEVLEAWRIVDGILTTWDPIPMALYRVGSWGPHEADDLLRCSHNSWAPLGQAGKRMTS